MAYTVLARRYRSRQFDDVVGQDHVARTLTNAIAQGRTAHAYLFVGTRGVGKTSMARIFAKALNAPGDQPAEIAQAIMEGRDTDVVEIDAASNTGVDNARQLIANAMYRPMRGPFKIYIIDEVHMLSTASFNALLKTMEEPPEHVKFILCTTDAHKVPATIQSRCQRFDFRNIPTAQISAHLADVLKQEGVRAEPELLHALARMGAGSMRDALSLLDRLLAAAEPGSPLSLDILERLLGLPDRQVLGALVDAFADADPAAALQRADDLLSRGVGVDQALESLAEALRDLLVLSACGAETTLVDLSSEARQRAAQTAARFDTAALVHMIALCDSVARHSKSSPAPRAVFDALMVRLALTDRVAQAAALLAGAPAAAAPNATATAPRRPAPPAAMAPAAKKNDAPRLEPAVTASAPARAPSPAGPATDPAQVWALVAERANRSPAMRVLFADLSLVELTPGAATLAVHDASIAASVRDRSRQIGELFTEVVGRPVRVQFSTPQSQAPAPEASPGAIDPALRDNPVVRQTQELFNAVIVSVEPDAD